MELRVQGLAWPSAATWRAAQSVWRATLWLADEDELLCRQRSVPLPLYTVNVGLSLSLRVSRLLPSDGGEHEQWYDVCAREMRKTTRPTLVTTRSGRLLSGGG